MNFQEAFKNLAGGSPVRREAWHSCRFIFIVSFDTYDEAKLVSEKGIIPVVELTVNDFFADDWSVAVAEYPA